MHWDTESIYLSRPYFFTCVRYLTLTERDSVFSLPRPPSSKGVGFARTPLLLLGLDVVSLPNPLAPACMNRPTCLKRICWIYGYKHWSLKTFLYGPSRFFRVETEIRDVDRFLAFSSVGRRVRADGKNTRWGMLNHRSTCYFRRWIHRGMICKIYWGIKRTFLSTITLQENCLVYRGKVYFSLPRTQWFVSSGGLR